ncbi:hypothetical protein IEN85_15785 [Pelagicoccus sp. NFK12]|uniref:Uncharacterized protein n=1 Tax=Pelagicoccus enzymogenes TaxID=2773457 RepID=A0A927II72_9BACT|nr:hypothetical protein [Pelagicoccus enzymogenes]MBD5780961.1 hypothetical protein [Pelagicoccus enzymogenes]
MLLLVVPAAYKFIAKNIGFPRDIAQKLEEEMSGTHQAPQVARVLRTRPLRPH